MGRLEHLFSVGGNIKWYSQYGSSLKKIKIELPYDSVSKFYTSAKKKSFLVVVFLLVTNIKYLRINLTSDVANLYGQS